MHDGDPLTSVAESRHARAVTTANLRKLGTPAAMLRAAAGLRLAALLLVFGPLTWTVATLAAIPLSG